MGQNTRARHGGHQAEGDQPQTANGDHRLSPIGPAPIERAPEVGEWAVMVCDEYEGWGLEYYPTYNEAFKDYERLKVKGATLKLVLVYHAT